MSQSQYKVSNVSDFAKINIGDPNVPPVSMLAYVLAHQSEWNLTHKLESPQNTETLSTLAGIQYYVMRHLQRADLKPFAHTDLGKDRISNSTPRLDLDLSVFQLIGVLGFIAIHDAGQFQQILDHNFKIDFPNNDRLRLDPADYQKLMRAIVAVAPADYLKEIYELAFELCTDENIPKDSSIHNRAKWLRREVIQVIEKRAKSDIRTDHRWAPDKLERLEVVAEIGKIRLEEAHRRLVDGIPVSKVSIDQTERDMHAMFDRCVEKANETRRKIDQKPTPIPRTIDHVKTPFDVMSLILLGENSLVPSR